MAVKKISIIIPVGNDYKIINCLNSISKNFNAKYFEVIVIADNCDKELDEKMRFFSRIIDLKIIKANSNKIGFLRNLAIKSANTNLFYFIDSDCELCDGAIEQAIYSGKMNLVTRGYIKFKGETRISKLDAELRQKRYDTNKSIAYCPNLVVRKEVFLKAGLYDKRFNYGSDGEFAKRLTEKGIKVDYNLKIKVIHYEPREVSKIIKTWIQYGEGRRKRYKNSSFPEKVRALYTPHLFDLRKGLLYNFIVASCFFCRWYGWTLEYIKEKFNK